MKYLALILLLPLAACQKSEPVPAATQADQATADKVAAVMAANDITLPQVAAYLYTYGFDVISRTEFRRWHWSPPTTGGPAAYYVVNFRVAVGDTALPIYIPQGSYAGPYWIRVVGYSGAGVAGPWSQTNVSAPGDLLPGVSE